MRWMIAISVTGFLNGQPTVYFNGFWKERFPTFDTCAAFLDGDNPELTASETELIEAAREHLNAPKAKVIVEFKCAPTIPDEGEPV